MKQYIRNIVIMMVLSATALTAWANGAVNTILTVNGNDAGNANPGTVSATVSGTTCTLTVTPADGYYLLGVSAVKTIDANIAQARKKIPGVDNSTITVTPATDNPADMSKVTKYTLTMPESPYDVEVTADFGTRASITTATIMLNPTSFTYDGTAKEPAVTVTDAQGTTLTAGRDYTVAYSDNVNVGKATVTVTGLYRYTGTKTAQFDITKALTMTVSATGYEGSYDGLPHGISVTVTEPEGATVQYGESENDCSLDASPTYTNAGTYTVYYKVTKTNYEPQTGSKEVVIKKAASVVTAVPVARDLTYNAKPQTLITAGTATGGTMVYKVGEDGSYATTLPTEQDADSYEVYYMVEGDNNHEDVAETKVTAVIRPAQLTEVKLVQSSQAYTGEDIWFEVDTVKAGDLVLDPGDYEIDGDSDTKLEVGTYTLTVNAAEESNFTGSASTQFSIVNRLFDLWIGDVQVTDLNRADVLGDRTADKAPSVMFDGRHTLVLTNDSLEMPHDIVSDLADSLIIYVIGKSNYIGRVMLKNPNANTTLTFTGNGNFPGRIYLNAPEGQSVISGFGNLELQQNLALLKPKKGQYLDQNLCDSLKQVANEAVIGSPLEPLVEEQVISFDEDDFMTTNEEGDEEEADLINAVINYLLYTINQTDDETEGDYYDPDDHSLVLNTPLTEEQLKELEEHEPTTDEYAALFNGITGMLAAGQGNLVLEIVTAVGQRLGVKIGDMITYLESAFRDKVEIPYSVLTQTYFQLFLGSEDESESRSKDKFRPAKKTLAMVKVYSVTVKPDNVQSSNPVSNVLDDYPTDLLPEDEQRIDFQEREPLINGIIVVRTSTERGETGLWYNINGQRVDQPLTKGLYIKDRKKLIVK